MTILFHALALGPATFFVFFALNNAPFLRPAHRLLAKLHPMLPRCPWCTAPYVALPLAIALTPTDVPAIIVTTLAASTFAGLLGSLLPDDGEPTDDD